MATESVSGNPGDGNAFFRSSSESLFEFVAEIQHDAGRPERTAYETGFFLQVAPRARGRDSAALPEPSPRKSSYIVATHASVPRRNQTLPRLSL